MKGILFTEENFGLSVYVHKSQTRRVPEPLDKFQSAVNIDDYKRPCIAHTDSDFKTSENLSKGTYALFYPKTDQGGAEALPKAIKFRYEPDEILYVKEPIFLTKEIAPIENEPLISPIKPKKYTRAGETGYVFYKYLEEKWKVELTIAPWQNKMFMKEDFARFYIKITFVNIERLKEISDNDCFREGIMKCGDGGYGLFNTNLSQIVQHGALPQSAYQNIWDSINGAGSSTKNPYLMVYDYVIHNNLEELQTLETVIFQPFPYNYNNQDLNQIGLIYDCHCGLNEVFFNFGKRHPRWKDIADNIVDYCIKSRYDGYFVINHSRFKYGFVNNNRAYPFPEVVKLYAEASYKQSKLKHESVPN